MSAQPQAGAQAEKKERSSLGRCAYFTDLLRTCPRVTNPSAVRVPVTRGGVGAANAAPRVRTSSYIYVYCTRVELRVCVTVLSDCMLSLRGRIKEKVMDGWSNPILKLHVCMWSRSLVFAQTRQRERESSVRRLVQSRLGHARDGGQVPGIGSPGATRDLVTLGWGLGSSRGGGNQ